MKTSGIYRIDLGNDWFYIGSAASLRHRKSKHRGDLERKVHSNQIMQRCWNKYGIFKFMVLEECAIDELIICEQIHLDKHFDNPKNANIARIAGSSLGVTRSDETRAKISAAGKNRSVEHRARLSAASKGRFVSDEARAKISAGLTGYKHSAETLKKRSKITKDYWARKRAAKTSSTH